MILVFACTYACLAQLAACVAGSRTASFRSTSSSNNSSRCCSRHPGSVPNQKRDQSTSFFFVVGEMPTCAITTLSEFPTLGETDMTPPRIHPRAPGTQLRVSPWPAQLTRAVSRKLAAVMMARSLVSCECSRPCSFCARSSSATQPTRTRGNAWANTRQLRPEGQHDTHLGPMSIWRQRPVSLSPPWHDRRDSSAEPAPAPDHVSHHATVDDNNGTNLASELESGLDDAGEVRLAVPQEDKAVQIQSVAQESSLGRKRLGIATV